jgi:hypothetical protein
LRRRAHRVMAFFDLCVAVLLFFNSVAILNEDRFLAKRASRSCAASPHGCRRPLRAPRASHPPSCAWGSTGGWHFNDFASGAPGAAKSLKGQALGIINAVSYMRSAAASRDSRSHLSQCCPRLAARAWRRAAAPDGLRICLDAQCR